MTGAEKKNFFQLRSLYRISGLVGVAIAWSATYFLEDWDGPVFWTLICISVVLGYGGAWGGLSSQWGSTPFTNDPLGWRKAKKTYADSAEHKRDEDKRE